MGREGLSAVLAHVNEGDAGLCVCIGGFTRDAEDFARMQASSFGSSFTRSSTTSPATVFADANPFPEAESVGTRGSARVGIARAML